MKYVALLRGINVGKGNWIDRKELEALFVSLACEDVFIFINSGNILFDALEKRDEMGRKLEAGLKEKFGIEIPVLLKTKAEMKKIADAIPAKWKNDDAQKSDVAYLFPEVDEASTLDDLPLVRQFVDARYVKGAILFNVERKFYYKSRLNKIIGHKHYHYMTVRNVNTARHLAGEGESA